MSLYANRSIFAIAVLLVVAIYGTREVARAKAADLEAELAPLGVGELAFQPVGAAGEGPAFVAECEKILAALGRAAAG